MNFPDCYYQQSYFPRQICQMVFTSDLTLNMAIKIEYFSDLLCIWAYSGQIRVDQLKQNFADKIDIKYRFMPVFAAARAGIERNWKESGGVKGFNKHLLTVAKNWSHINISPDLWIKVSPESSSSPHLYLKAIQILAEQGDINNFSVDDLNGRTLVEESIWQFRDSFFRRGIDISRRRQQDKVAEKLQLPLSQIHEIIDSGKAHAALHQDEEAAISYKIAGSPTLVLNEGRQLLYGNVGYRIIEANVSELLRNPEHGEASWC